MPYESPVPAGYVDRLFSLNDQVAIVTGGASGLGEAIVHGFVQSGARAVVADIDLGKAREVAASLRDGARPPLAMAVDVTSRGSLDGLVRDVVERWGRVDVLVNSAGTVARYPAEDFPEAEWDRIIAVNLKGTFLACQACGRQMLVQGHGSIVNIASIGGLIAYPGSTAYVQSKGGVVQLTRSLALEWVGRGVRVNAIAPSIFDTPLFRRVSAKASPTSEFVMARTPIGRRGEPAEIVGTAIFLASAASTMVTGHILAVDGGYLTA